MNMKKPPKLSGQSFNPQEALLGLLKEKCPEAFSDGKIDVKKLKATLGESVDVNGERYGLSWAGKNDCFRHIQEPTTATLKPLRQKSVDFDGTKNIFIEGDNLQALKILQKSYYGQVKTIYIDPPYNTGSDSFIYPDRFQESKEEYMERIGQKEEGHLTRDGMWQKNSKDNGHYHSNWLSMMFPRLFLARNLLRQDGVIFVSIDDHEVQNLKMIMDEVFGPDNWVGTIVWNNVTDNNPTNIAIEHEYIHCYARNKSSLESVWKSRSSDVKEMLVKVGTELTKKYKDSGGLADAYQKWFKQNKDYLWPLDRYKYIDNGGVYTGSQSVHNPGREGYRYDVLHPVTKKPTKQPLMGYRFPEETMKKLLEEGKILFGEDENKIIELKVYASEYEDKLPSILTLDGRLGAYELRDLFTGYKKLFDNPKPTAVVKQLLSFNTGGNDLILDFFAGSGTTADAVMQLNSEDKGQRRCISVQLPEECEKDSEAMQAGFKTIADIAMERIRRAGKKFANTDAGFKTFVVDDSNFKIWRSDLKGPDELAAQMEMFIDNVKKESTQENVLCELMLKTGLDLNTSVQKIESKTGAYFKLNGGKLIVCIQEGITEALADKILTEKPDKFICLDKAFESNDQLKTNVLLQMEQAGVDFLVI